MFSNIKIKNQIKGLEVGKNIKNVIITGKNGVGKSKFNVFDKNFKEVRKTLIKLGVPFENIVEIEELNF